MDVKKKRFNNAVCNSAVPIMKFRAEAEIDGAKQMWKSLNSLLEIDESTPPFQDKGLQIAFEARTRMVEELCAESGIKCIFEPACGFSTHGITTAQKDSNITYVESDLPELVKLKKEILGDNLPRNYSLITGNALERSNFENAALLLSQNKNFKQGAIVITEGLMLVLDAKEKEQIAKNVAWLLKESGGGFWITTGIDVQKNKEQDLSSSGAAAFVNIAQTKSLNAYKFETEEARDKVFENAGLSFTSLDCEPVLKKLVLPKKFGFDNAQVDTALVKNPETCLFGKIKLSGDTTKSND